MNTKKYGKKALDRELVRGTRCKTLTNDKGSLHDWIHNSEVLVGIPDPPDRASPAFGTTQPVRCNRGNMRSGHRHRIEDWGSGVEQVCDFIDL